MAVSQPRVPRWQSSVAHACASLTQSSVAFTQKKIETNIQNRVGKDTFLIFGENVINVFNKDKENYMLIKFPKKFTFLQTIF